MQLCKTDVYLSKPLPHTPCACVCVQPERPVRRTRTEPVHANNRRLTLFFLSEYGNRTLEYSRFSAPQKNSFLNKIRQKRSRPDESRWSCTTAKAPYQPTAAAAASGMKRRIELARPFGTTNRRSLSVCAPETERREHKKVI